MIPSGVLGGIEAGGTKFNCAVGSGPDEVIAAVRIPTTTPEVTLPQVVDFFRPYCESGAVHALGIGSFGPCDLDPGSPTYGYITNTPKPGWHYTNLVGSISSALGIRVAFDTDVNAAALAEFTWGAAVGLDPCLYLTVGTGIGGGLISGGAPLHGLHHPEMGHIRVPHDRARDPFPGACPYHGDCFEGLAAGPAIQARFGRPGEGLADDDPYWELEAEYIAAALCSLILVVSPRRILIGGGIMQRAFLFPRVREKVVRWLGGYVAAPQLAADVDGYIIPPALGPRAGVLGALALARSLHGSE